MLVPGGMQDLSSLTRDWTHTLCSGSVESSLLYRQGSALECLLDGEMVCWALKSYEVRGKAAVGLRGMQRKLPTVGKLGRNSAQRHLSCERESKTGEKRAWLDLKGHDRKSGLFYLNGNMMPPKRLKERFWPTGSFQILNSKNIKIRQFTIRQNNC